METYSKNIYRGILRNRGSYIGAVLIISLGIFVYCAMTEFLMNFRNATEIYCEENGFADAFATVKGMPKSKLAELEDIEGIREVFGRLEANARLILPDENKIVTLHIMTWSKNDIMNRMVLDPSPEELTPEDIYIGPLLVENYGILMGDELKVICGNRTKQLTFLGNAYSPEQMFILPDESVPAMDNTIFDLAAMSEDGIEALTGQNGIVTNIGFRLESGYSFADVQYAVKEKLKPYGYVDLCSRRNQTSYASIIEEIESYELIIAILPTIFMAVTMFMLYVVLKKMVDGDRTLIGTLKAFGVWDGEILFQYMRQGVLIGLLGGLLPIVFAEIAGKALYDDDITYYSIPVHNYIGHLSVWLKGICISLFTSLTALFLGVVEVLRITPAESMRPAAPNKGISFGLPLAVKQSLNARQVMGLRAIFRNPLRSMIIALAVSLPFALISSFSSFDDVMQQTLYDQYIKAETYDLRLRLENEINDASVDSLVDRLRYVKEYESISSYTVQLKCENRAEYTGLTILNPGSNMFRIIDIYNEYFEPRSDGLLISEGLAHKMNIKAGDVIEISASELTEPDETVLIPVIRLVKSGFGSGCYLSAEGVQRYFRTTFHPNMVLLNIEDGKKDVVLSQIQNLGDITYSIESGGMLEKSVDMMSTTILMLDFLSIFSLIVGGIIIYSIISISMRERTNEFGTMIILGMDSMEVSEIIVFEQTFNFVIGILLGFPLSGLMCKIVEYAVSTDTLSVEMHISKEMYLGVFLICLTETAFSIFIIVRGILSMQLTDVLKNRE